MKRADSQLLVIFGASGDLTGRKLLPALFELFIGDMLPEHFAILGAARTGYTDEEFRAEQRKHILEARGNKETNSAELDKFLRILFYLAFDSTNSAPNSWPARLRHSGRLLQPPYARKAKRPVSWCGRSRRTGGSATPDSSCTHP